MELKVQSSTSASKQRLTIERLKQLRLGQKLVQVEAGHMNDPHSPWAIERGGLTLTLILKNDEHGTFVCRNEQGSVTSFFHSDCHLFEVGTIASTCFTSFRLKSGTRLIKVIYSRIEFDSIGEPDSNDVSVSLDEVIEVVTEDIGDERMRCRRTSDGTLFECNWRALHDHFSYVSLSDNDWSTLEPGDVVRCIGNGRFRFNDGYTQESPQCMCLFNGATATVLNRNDDLMRLIMTRASDGKLISCNRWSICELERVPRKLLTLVK